MVLNELKNKIRLKLINWLEIDKLNNKLINIRSDISDVNQYMFALRKDYRNDYNDLDNKYNSLHRTIQECVKMGADIEIQPTHNNKTGSWAVVCFTRGNTNIVKFIDLDTHGRNGYEIFNYLKQFDAPLSCGLHRDLFYQWDREEK
ncbi:TPA: hypothetical protein LA460_000116 [Clostridium botulinum]|nr:hypothetical protein [Clostridium botulinum]HBJ1652721.1 hypothetical protein [Clostridium botulinum]